MRFEGRGGDQGEEDQGKYYRPYRHGVRAEASDAARLNNGWIGSMIVDSIGHESEMGSSHDCIADDGYGVAYNDKPLVIGCATGRIYSNLW